MTQFETSPLGRIRNIGVVAHVDAGKTTLTERILYYTGRTHRIGSVDAGTTVTDWMEQERERGITIVSAAISAEWNGYRINLIDTPGHIDFTSEVQRALRVLDGCIVVFDGVNGVEPQSETVWRQADQHGVPRLCFLNKMDRVGADFDAAVETIEKRLGARTACLQIPVGSEGGFSGVIDLIERRALSWQGEQGEQVESGPVPPELSEKVEEARARLLERICETDDELLAMYLEDEEPGAERLKAALRAATIRADLFPTYCGTALRNVGVQPLLEGVVEYLPSPLDRGAVEGVHPKSGATLLREPDPKAPLAALVFKIVNDAYMGHLAYVRVYSGRIAHGTQLHDATRGSVERVTRLVHMYANHREDVEEIMAGDIAAIPGLNKVRTGDTLCPREHPLLLESIEFPEPVIRALVEPRRAEDIDGFHAALAKLSEEDPTLVVGTDEETGQTVIGGMGELHLEVLLARLESEHSIQGRMGRPQVSYRETVTKTVEDVEASFDQVLGGKTHFAGVRLTLEPGEPGSGFQFESKVSRRTLPKVLLEAIESGVHGAALSGPVSGNPLTDLMVRVVGVEVQESVATELAFHNAAAAAFREACAAGGPVLLEPLFTFEVMTPTENTGAVLNQLSSRRARIDGVEARPGGIERIAGQVPLAEMFGYVTDLRSVTQGRGSFSMEFECFGPAG